MSYKKTAHAIYNFDINDPNEKKYAGNEVALKALQTWVSMWFLYHLPIYEQWATFIFQVVIYIFFY
jgi:hypothetical protein